MADSNKVVWSEGMFLRPQHFQQHDRWIERLVEGRCAALGHYFWGLQELVLDRELLRLGKLSLIRLRGVFPDGTPFSIPDIEPLPAVLEYPVSAEENTVYLCLPLRRPGAREVSDGVDNVSSLTRLHATKAGIRNATTASGEEAEIDLGDLAITLRTGNDDLSGYAAIPIARIVEHQQNKPLELDEQFIPPMLSCDASSLLTSLLKELGGLIKQRGDALGQRLADSGRSGSAEVADYMLLQVINRIEPLCTLLSQISGLHPLDFYQELVQMTGELATFTTKEKRAPEFPPYQHDDLTATFIGTFDILRRCLGTVLEQTAMPMELNESKYGIHVAPIKDRSMMTTAGFFVAVKANMPTESLRKSFPNQAKIAPVERVREIISAQLPGIPIRSLPVAPRQIPYHAGFCYFELSCSGDLWQAMKSSAGFAIHIGGDFPGLTMELWAIRNQ